MSYPDPAGIFAGTANSYSRYRLARPPLFLDLLAGLAPTGPVADIGTGPGSLALALAARGRSVIAVDANPEMIDEAERDMMQRGLTGRVQWHVADAHHLPDMPPLAGATFADSFHWLDRAAVLADLDRRIKWGGFVAVVMLHIAGGAKPWWNAVIDRVLRRYVGPVQYAGAGQQAQLPVGDHETVLRASAFDEITVVRTDQFVALTLDELVGLQYTQAYSSPPVLGDALPDFDADLRRALLAVEPTGQFMTTIQAGMIIARRGEDQ